MYAFPFFFSNFNVLAFGDELIQAVPSLFAPGTIRSPERIG